MRFSPIIDNNALCEPSRTVYVISVTYNSFHALEILVLIPQRTSLTIRGNFNPFVFSPDWMEAQGLVTPNGAIKLTLGAVWNGVQCQVEGREWVVDQNSLAIRSQTFDKKLGDIAKSVLSLLPHTPVFSIGSTFTFATSDESDFSSLIPVLGQTRLTNLSDADSQEPDLVRWGLVFHQSDTRVDMSVSVGSNGVTATLSYFSKIESPDRKIASEKALASCGQYDSHFQSSQKLVAKILSSRLS